MNVNLKRGGAGSSRNAGDQIAIFSPVNNIPVKNYTITAKTPLNDMIGASTITPNTRTTASSFSRTPTSASSSALNDSHTYVVLTEGRGSAREEVGLCKIDLHRPEIVLMQLSDTQSYTNTIQAIYLFNPLEILVPSTFTHSTRLVRMIQSRINVNVSPVVRRWFDANNGLVKLQQLCAPAYANCLLDLQHKYYALSALNALLMYFESINKFFITPKSIRVIHKTLDGITAIDIETASRLELICPLLGTNTKACLFGVLNYCFTNGGRRLLRASILQPPCNESLVHTRHQSIAELISNTTLWNRLRMIMPHFVNVDHMLTICIKPAESTTVESVCEMQMNYTLVLKSILSAIRSLMDVLADGKSYFFVNFVTEMTQMKHDAILKRILTVINADVKPIRGVSGDQQRLFAVRNGVRPFLDLKRRIYSVVIDDMNELATTLASKYNLPLKLENNYYKGFHLSMKIKDKSYDEKQLPSEFILISKQQKSISLTTPDMAEHNEKIKSLKTDILVLSNSLICDMLNEIRGDIVHFYTFCENIANLDVIVSLAYVANQQRYCRPTFATYTKVHQSRHPVLEKLRPSSTVANDIISTPEWNFHLITGPNMSGKSIYIRQVALIQIMAQIGSYVPADAACFRMADRIFSRLGHDDSLNCNASTFQMDLREMQAILSHVTPRSLIIVDEFCRGTAHSVGTSIAWAISEELIRKDAFTFFATHFLTLSRLQDLYFNVVNWWLVTDVVSCRDGDRLRYHHKLAKGVTNIDAYGIKAARCSAIPRAIVDEAESIVSTLEPTVKPIEFNRNQITVENMLYQKITALKVIHMAGELTKDLLKQTIVEFRKSINLSLGTNAIQFVDVRYKLFDKSDANDINRMDDSELHVDLARVESEIEPNVEPNVSVERATITEVKLTDAVEEISSKNDPGNKRESLGTGKMDGNDVKKLRLDDYCSFGQGLPETSSPSYSPRTNSQLASTFGSESSSILPSTKPTSARSNVERPTEIVCSNSSGHDTFYNLMRGLPTNQTTRENVIVAGTSVEMSSPSMISETTASHFVGYTHKKFKKPVAFVDTRSPLRVDILENICVKPPDVIASPSIATELSQREPIGDFNFFLKTEKSPNQTGVFNMFPTPVGNVTPAWVTLGNSNVSTDSSSNDPKADNVKERIREQMRKLIKPNADFTVDEPVPEVVKVLVGESESEFNRYLKENSSDAKKYKKQHTFDVFKLV